MVFRDLYSSLLRLTPLSLFTWFELWDLCLVVPTNADHTVCFNRARGKRTVKEGGKNRQAELETGSASSEGRRRKVGGERGGKDSRDAFQNTHTDTDILRHFKLKLNNKD